MKTKRIFLWTTVSLTAGVICFSQLATLQKSPFSSKDIYDRNGVLLRQVFSSRYGTSFPTVLPSLPPHFLNTLIFVEDKRFYQHCGIDPLAIARAAKQNFLAGKRVSGASTITQQLVRNIYFYPRTIPYKILESARAIAIDLRYSKKRILEEYLNRVPYGNNLYGIEAAARVYLGKPASELSLAEGAFLCSIPSSNNRYDPYRTFARTKKKQERILARMREAKILSQEQFEQARDEELKIFPRDNAFLAPHFCNWLIEKYGDLLPEKTYTTLDYNLQQKVEWIINNHLQKLRDGNVNNAAALVLDNATGEILAFVGSADFYSEQQSGQVNGVFALRQPGSAIKPFIYALAFENGYTASNTVADIETNIGIADGGFFSPQNYDKKYHGIVRLRTALACSYNIATVNLGHQIGEEQILERLRKIGLTSMKKPASFYGPGICLGNGEVTLFEMTRAYMALANSGRLSQPKELIDQPQIMIGQPYSSSVTGLVTDILSDNNARIPAFGEFSPLNLPFHCAAKTGTTKNFRDNWTLGYTPRYTVGVWVGNFNGAAMYSVSGISGAAPIFRDIMITLEIKQPDRNFNTKDEYARREVCAKSGELASQICPEKISELYLKDNQPKKYCSLHKIYRIDTRVGLLARKDCPEEFVEKRVYEVYPSAYYEWVKNNQIDLPPTGSSELGSESDTAKTYYTLSFPQNGDVFKIDPDLRKDYQRISLKPQIGNDVTQVKWTIDDKSFISSQYPFILSWGLEAGKHSISFEAFKKDRKFKGEQIYVLVLP